MTPTVTALTLGVEQERRRILGIVWKQFGMHKANGDERIAGVLDALAREIELDHHEDNER